MEREINLLSEDELNAVVGGRTNLANLGNRPHVLPPGSVSAGDSFKAKVEVVSGLLIFAEICIFAALW